MKRQKYLAAAIAAAMMLTICIFGLNGSSRAEQSDGRRFSEIEYVRPDPAVLAERVSAVTESLDAGRSERRIMKLLDECYSEFYNCSTMYTVAGIRYFSNLTDEYYEQEYAACGESYSSARQLMEQLYSACAKSKLAAKLERDYFWNGFTQEYGGDEAVSYSDEAVALMQRESELLSRYYALTASPTIVLDGVEVDYYDYISTAGESDYYNAGMEYYRQYNSAFSEIYIELIKTRRALAAELDYDNYEQMQYSYFARDYTPAETAALLEDIKTYIVPLYEEIMAAEPYSQIDYWDMTAERLMGLLGAVADKLGGTAAEAFDFMLEYELYNVGYDRNKANQSFTSYLDSYDEPYIFISPYGDTEDVLTLAHEFGHYMDSYINYNSTLSLDLNECFSQAMEYIVTAQGAGIIDEAELNSLRRIKFLNTLGIYAEQGSFAEFENRVYALDDAELTAENINAISLAAAREYGCCRSGEEEYFSLSWVDITHFFESPFYIISYAVSNEAAVQIYELELNSPGAGWDKYNELLPRDYQGFIESLEAVGLESPFAAGRIEHTAENLRAELYAGQLAA